MFHTVNSLEGKRQMVALYSKMIQDIDSEKNYSPEILKRRNELVELKRSLDKDLPLQFSEGEKVIVKFNRNVNGHIVEVFPNDKMYIIKPNDTLYTSPVKVHESLLLKKDPA